MTLRRILILAEPGLLAQGLLSLLASDRRLEIVAAANDGEPLATRIRELGPDAVLVSQDKLQLCMGDPPVAIQLDGIPLVVALSENENRMRVYHIQERGLTGLKELIETLASGGEEK